MPRMKIPACPAQRLKNEQKETPREKCEEKHEEAHGEPGMPTGEKRYLRHVWRKEWGASELLCHIAGILSEQAKEEEHGHILIAPYILLYLP